jgi:hypothetical protein
VISPSGLGFRPAEPFNPVNAQVLKADREKHSLQGRRENLQGSRSFLGGVIVAWITNDSNQA